MKISSVLAGAALCLFASTAFAAPAGLNFGGAGHLVDGKGMTMYYFDKDALNVSNCFEECAAKWPPLMAKPGAAPEGDFTLAKHGNQSQWAYKGQPLYYWAGDFEAGQKGGDGLGGVWHIIPAGGLTPAKASSSY